MIVDGEGLLGTLIGDLNRSEAGIRSERLRQLEAQLLIEQQPVVLGRDGVTHRQTRDGAVQPVAGQHDEVGRVQPIDQPVELLRIVVVIVLHIEAHVHPEAIFAVEAQRYAIVPVLVGDNGAPGLHRRPIDGSRDQEILAVCFELGRRQFDRVHLAMRIVRLLHVSRDLTLRQHLLTARVFGNRHLESLRGRISDRVDQVVHRNRLNCPWPRKAEGGDVGATAVFVDNAGAVGIRHVTQTQSLGFGTVRRLVGNCAHLPARDLDRPAAGNTHKHVVTSVGLHRHAGKFENLRASRLFQVDLQLSSGKHSLTCRISCQRHFDNFRRCVVLHVLDFVERDRPQIAVGHGGKTRAIGDPPRLDGEAVAGVHRPVQIHRHLRLCRRAIRSFVVHRRRTRHVIVYPARRRNAAHRPRVDAGEGEGPGVGAG
ncbi:MAG: hypothetical protein MAG451_01738 [Anaerolineales bacterium]|nr:hypothetical protein [Anaerolineales bacterium]